MAVSQTSTPRQPNKASPQKMAQMRRRTIRRIVIFYTLAVILLLVAAIPLGWELYYYQYILCSLALEAGVLLAVIATIDLLLLLVGHYNDGLWGRIRALHWWTMFGLLDDIVQGPKEEREYYGFKLKSGEKVEAVVLGAFEAIVLFPAIGWFVMNVLFSLIIFAVVFVKDFITVSGGIDLTGIFQWLVETGSLTDGFSINVSNLPNSLEVTNQWLLILAIVNIWLVFWFILKEWTRLHTWFFITTRRGWVAWMKAFTHEMHASFTSIEDFRESISDSPNTGPDNSWVDKMWGGWILSRVFHISTLSLPSWALRASDIVRLVKYGFSVQNLIISLQKQAQIVGAANTALGKYQYGLRFKAAGDRASTVSAVRTEGDSNEPVVIELMAAAAEAEFESMFPKGEGDEETSYIVMFDEAYIQGDDPENPTPGVPYTRWIWFPRLRMKEPVPPQPRPSYLNRLYIFRESDRD